MDCYRIYGLTIASEWSLPGLPAAPVNAAIDVHIRYDAVPECLPEAPSGVPARGACFEAGRGSVLLLLPDIARLLVCDGREILVMPLHAEKSDAIALFLMNQALAILLLQRGLLVLHGGAVLMDGRVIAVGGGSGAGKSTLLAALQRQGHSVLSDEHCVLDVQQEGVTLLPGPRVLQLWQETLDALELSHPDLEPVRRGLHKFFLPLPAVAEAVPLHELCVLRWSESGSPQKSPLSGVAKWQALLDLVCPPGYVDGMQLRGPVGALCMQLARQIAVSELVRKREWCNLSVSIHQVTPGQSGPDDKDADACPAAYSSTVHLV